MRNSKSDADSHGYFDCVTGADGYRDSYCFSGGYRNRYGYGNAALFQLQLHRRDRQHCPWHCRHR
jgi:hypothetical protein